MGELKTLLEVALLPSKVDEALILKHLITYQHAFPKFNVDTAPPIVISNNFKKSNGEHTPKQDPLHSIIPIAALDRLAKYHTLKVLWSLHHPKRQEVILPYELPKKKNLSGINGM